MTLDLTLPITSSITKLFQKHGQTLGISSQLSQVHYSNKGAQFQCNGALAAAKVLKRSPRQIAQEWISLFSLEDRSNFTKLEIAGPGFININLSDEVLAHKLQLTQADERLSVPKTQDPKKIYIDFGGYNVAKQLHIGHLRSTIIGDTLQRVLRFMGDEVISDVHLGDWGTQMGMLIEAVREEQPDLSYFNEEDSEEGSPTRSPITLEDMNRLYPQASARSKRDPDLRAKASLATSALQRGHSGYLSLWRHFVNLSISEIKQDISPFDVHFSEWLGESDAQPLIPPLIHKLKEEGYAVESEGALIIPLTDQAGEEMIPVMLQKRDGGATYHTSDLATIWMRIRQHADSILYVVDARQEMHFQQIFRAVHLTQLTSQMLHLEHIKFGTINGEDGRPFKTRSGDTVKLRDVVEMAIEAARKRVAQSEGVESIAGMELEGRARSIAIAAIKFGDLRSHRTSDYILNLDDFCASEGKTGPYLLYAAVRIQSILNKATERGFFGGAITLTCQSDRTLALELTRFPIVLSQVYEKKLPHLLCEYLFQLSQAFSSFYQACNIVRQTDSAIQSSWISIISLCLRTLNMGLNLLGISVPSRM